MKIVKNFKENSLKIVLCIFVVFPILLFLNTGFLWDAPWKVLQAVIFSVVFTTILILPKWKKIVFWVSFLLFVVMAILYVVGLMDAADMVGSTGFGILIVNVLSYIPQLVKLGYIKEL